jgi:hypothetical protein
VPNSPGCGMVSFLRVSTSRWLCARAFLAPCQDLVIQAASVPNEALWAALMVLKRVPARPDEHRHQVDARINSDDTRTPRLSDGIDEPIRERPHTPYHSATAAGACSSRSLTEDGGIPWFRIRTAARTALRVPASLSETRRRSGGIGAIRLGESGGECVEKML